MIKSQWETIQLNRQLHENHQLSKRNKSVANAKWIFWMIATYNITWLIVTYISAQSTSSTNNSTSVLPVVTIESIITTFTQTHHVSLPLHFKLEFDGAEKNGIAYVCGLPKKDNIYHVHYWSSIISFLLLIIVPLVMVQLAYKQYVYNIELVRKTFDETIYNMFVLE